MSQAPRASFDAIVVGAGPSGLACAATMGRLGLAVAIVDKADTVAAVWHRHYDRLHLHSDRGHSALPGLAMPREFPRYPSRDQAIDYFERYATHFELRPMFGRTVQSVRRNAGSGGWRVETDREVLSAPVVVIATGWADHPHRPHWPDSERFLGRVMHSIHYRNAAALAGQRVLVVGFGNSGGEIALDLAEAGVDVCLAVRGPVQIVPRDLLGLPILTWSIAESALPPRLADIVNAPAIRLALGPMRGLGLEIAAKGPLRMIAEDQRVPLLDAGTLAQIRKGAIRVRGGIERFTRDGVVLAGSGAEAFDCVVLATGFRPDLRGLLPDDPDLFDAAGMPLACGRATARPGLFFCGLIASPTGQLRQIGIEAERIARLAAACARGAPALSRA